jgi:hypothetical protein
MGSMKLLGWVVVMLGACSTSGGGSDAHERLTDCPSWSSPGGPIMSCEAACEPRTAETPDVMCKGARNAVANPYGDHSAISCSTTFEYGDAHGCCAGGPDVTGKNIYILFYECP